MLLNYHNIRAFVQIATVEFAHVANVAVILNGLLTPQSHVHGLQSSRNLAMTNDAAQIVNE